MSSASQTPRRTASLSLARERLRAMHPMDIAYRAHVRYCRKEDTGGPAPRAGAAEGTHPQAEGHFDLPFLNRHFHVTYPGGLVKPADGKAPPQHAPSLLMLHYLAHADGHQMADRWAAFRELPNGLMYHRAFRARVEPPLLAAFGSQPNLFRSASRAIGGSPIDFGDAGFMFSVLPRIRMAIILHLGDEELPPAIRVLYDGAAGHYLPAEDLAVLGGLLVGALLKAAPR